MRVLLTGGAGFIGSHLAERLLHDGHSLSILDDLNGFYSPEQKRGNLRAISERGEFVFAEIDICDEVAVERAFAETRPDLVIHLAACAGVQPSLKNPLLYERTNVRGTLVLLEASRRHMVRKFLFASSSSVYGISNRVPFREDDQTDRPISPYAATKLAGEQMCYTYSHLYHLPVVCFRFFTVYGPRQRPDLAIRKFAERIDRGEPISVYGDGMTSRDYTYIDDIVQGIVSAIAHDCVYDVFNLGNSQPVTLNTLIQTLEDTLGKKADVRRLPIQPGDVPITFADISKAERLLQYRPSTRFAEGIAKFVRWHRSDR